MKPFVYLGLAIVCVVLALVDQVSTGHSLVYSKNFWLYIMIAEIIGWTIHSIFVSITYRSRLYRSAKETLKSYERRMAMRRTNA